MNLVKVGTKFWVDPQSVRAIAQYTNSGSTIWVSSNGGDLQSLTTDWNAADVFEALREATVLPEDPNDEYH